jgi:hypothetical protein
MEYPDGLTPVDFVRLTLSRAGSSISTNLYLRGVEEGNYRAIRQLPKARIKTATDTRRQGNRWRWTTLRQNLSAYPPLMTRLKAVRENRGDRILPVIYGDNYFNLMPEENRTVRTELNYADTRGENPRIVGSRLNVKAPLGEQNVSSVRKPRLIHFTSKL